MLLKITEKINRKKSFWTEEKETLVSLHPGLSANLPSNNWALLDSNLSDRWRNPAFEKLGSVVANEQKNKTKQKGFLAAYL